MMMMEGMKEKQLLVFLGNRNVGLHELLLWGHLYRAFKKKSIQNIFEDAFF
jgi:hypothetical protein